MIDDVLSTLLYSVIGIVLLLLTILLVNKVFRLNLHHELVEEHNVAFGILLAGVAIAIGIIVAGVIGS